LEYPKTKDVDILVQKKPVFEDIPKSMLFGIGTLLIYDLGGQHYNKIVEKWGKSVC